MEYLKFIIKNKYLLIVFVLSLSVLQLFATDRYQLITQAEYFINTDPGEGEGIPIQVEQGFTVDFSVDNIQINYNDKIFVRVKNENGVWSSPYCRKLGNNFIEEAKVYKVTYPVPNYRKLIEVESSIDNKQMNGLIASAVSDPIEGDNLKPGDTLLVQFKGVNGIWGNQYEIILAKPDLQIPKPMNLTSEVIIESGKTKVKLSWKDNSDAESQFSIERNQKAGIIKNSDDKIQADWQEIAKVDKNVTEYLDDNVANNKIYEWRVRALGLKEWMNSEYSNTTELLVVGVEDLLINKDNIVLYPNPCSDIVTINYTLNKPGYVNINVFNSSGQKVWEYNHFSDAGNIPLQLNTNIFNSGIYFLRLAVNHKICIYNLIINQ